MLYGDKSSVGALRVPHRGRVNSAGRVDSDHCEFDATLVDECCQWPEDRVVFGGCRDDVIAWLEQTVQGDIECIGGVEGKDDLLGCLGAQQGGGSLAAIP